MPKIGTFEGRTIKSPTQDQEQFFVRCSPSLPKIGKEATDSSSDEARLAPSLFLIASLPFGPQSD